MLACLNKPSYKQAVGKIGLVGHSLLTTNLEHNLQINTNVVVQCFSVKTLLLITDHWKFKLELTINSLFPIKQEFGFDLLNIHQSLIFESNFTEYCGHYVLLGDMKLFTLSHANFFFFFAFDMSNVEIVFNFERMSKMLSTLYRYPFEKTWHKAHLRMCLPCFSVCVDRR